MGQWLVATCHLACPYLSLSVPFQKNIYMYFQQKYIHSRKYIPTTSLVMDIFTSEMTIVYLVFIFILKMLSTKVQVLKEKIIRPVVLGLLSLELAYFR